MVKPLNHRTEQALSTQKLSDPQLEAAAERERNVVVTAGAGSGKTRTLVARYLSLLADGIHSDKVVAVTFTEKAANEMRARVRSAIRAQVVNADGVEDQKFWSGLEQQIDAARIGTIHSLCTEILRHHPALAEIDPLFEVLDEGEANILLMDAVENALVQITQDQKYQPLFEWLRVDSLESMLTEMLKKRLELASWIAADFSMERFIKSVVEPFLTHEELISNMQDLRSFSPQVLESDTTATGVAQVQGFLLAWQQVEKSRGEGDFLNCLQTLTNIRHTILNKRGGKESSKSKANLLSIKELFDEMLGWVGKEFNPELEEKIAQIMPLLKDAFTHTLTLYSNSLSNRRGLDFDDLEYKALALLQKPEIAQKWQSKVDALLVDEFQDTNQRQRIIIQALTAGKPGSLFVVGDTRQSIYRFRGADVTVFRDVRLETAREGGLICNLVESHRTHRALMDATDELLGAIMGTEEDSGKPFVVTFTKMKPMRKDIIAGLQAPFLEVFIGAGDDADDGRAIAANLLADQLLAYKQAGAIQDWKDVALLFRASGAYPVYEQAFEAAGIPYVTIAGSGFYDRPEIRDILNLLRSLADPWDDLAMVGLLRSPAVGMSDRGISQLRWPHADGDAIPLRQALEQNTSLLSLDDQLAAEFAASLFAEFGEITGSIPVAALLQRLIEKTHYRVILAGTADRGWRNIEKLLMDAYQSRHISVHAYLEYVQKIRDSGVREGEAAGAAEDALQLMTIHKSKGLEFPWVILADAGRSANPRKDRWLVAQDLLAFSSDRQEYKSLVFNHLKLQDNLKEEAETRRLLYVALTRARDKLIVNGHFSKTSGRITVNGWLKEILNILDIDPKSLVENPPDDPLCLKCEELLSIKVRKEQVEFPEPIQDIMEEQIMDSSIFLLNQQFEESTLSEEIVTDSYQDLFETTDKFPLWVGKLLHQAIHRWEFHNDEVLEQFLEKSALQLGIFHDEKRQHAIGRAKMLMLRLRTHPIYAEISGATRRYHEVPYETVDEIQNERGRMDILYQTETGWKIVDFKSDHLTKLADLPQERRVVYRSQLLRYQNAVFQHIKIKPSANFCFLNFSNEIFRIEVDDF